MVVKVFIPNESNNLANILRDNGYAVTVINAEGRDGAVKIYWCIVTRKKLNKVLNEVGFLEARKYQMMHDMTSINKDIEDFKKVLEKQYGQININLEDGSYKEIEKENV